MHTTHTYMYAHTHTQAPNLLITLIYMFLKFPSPSPDGVTEYSVFGPSRRMANYQVCVHSNWSTSDNAVFSPPQSHLQQGLVVLMVLCVPWMLLVKPIWIIIKRKWVGDGLGTRFATPPCEAKTGWAPVHTV